MKSTSPNSTKILKRNSSYKKRSSRYGVFIIESLRGDEYFDGENLQSVLELSEIPVQYRLVDSIEEFKKAILEFEKLNYRYLHFSCHGSRTTISLNDIEINSNQLCELLSSSIESKRIFLASCEGGNKGLAGPLIKECKAMSVIGCPTLLGFDKSAIFWPVFYHVMYEADKKRMSRALIQDKLKKCVDLIEVQINYYGRSTSKSKIRRLKFRPNERVDNRLLFYLHKIISKKYFRPFSGQRYSIRI